MRVCISYMHLYPIKSRNHTSPSRKCKLCFWANMQVASTLWPDIKSQKISERWFKLNWTKCSPRTNPNPLKRSRTLVFRPKKAQTSPADKIGGGWHHWQAGRPAHGTNHPQPLGAGLSWASSCLITGDCLVLTWLEVVLGLHLSIWAWICALIFFVILCRAKVCLQPAY